MLFQNIHPFGRYLRFMPVGKTQEYAPFIPYDARLFLCIGGKGVIMADGAQYKMERGCCIIINSGVPYHLIAEKKEALYFAANFDFTFENSSLTTPVPPARVEQYRPEELIGHVEFSDMPEFDRVVYLKGMTALEQKCTAAEREYSRKLNFNDGIVSGILSEILFECARVLISAENQSADIVEQILDYIHQNFNKPLTNKSIGDIFSFHPNYINELVRKSTGQPLHRYLLQVRISKAIDLLEETNNSVSSIADTCGFQSLYYFSRYFKKMTGFTPTEYRRK